MRATRRFRGGLGVDRVGFAGPAAGLAVRPIDLDDRDALFAQVGREAGPVGARALHSGQDQQSERLQPGQQRGIAGPGGGKRGMAEHPAGLIDRGRGVSIPVGVDTTGDLELRLGACSWHRGTAVLPLARDEGGTHQPRRADKTVMGACWHRLL